ncbi:uncharacterized protein LTR77_011168 [Saxophila tyrrhenica]|uniref:Uncharacterized protein n=1 Tax=Saxophila tyrrhenica TaxID=1690608 RepID=A0AAV9NTU0_9PEZI|nr:hypothetical protein LTR77_011168 [Saxophila tyrrhenica]
MHHSIAALSAVLAMVIDVSAIAFPQATTTPTTDALTVLCSAIADGASTPSACQTAATPSTAAAPYCTNFADPHYCGTGIDYCTCSNGAFSIASGSNPCPYTTDPGSDLAYTTPTCSSTAASPTATVPDACASGSQASDDTASCWSDLGLTDYVNSWWEDNQDSCGGTVVHPNEDGDPDMSFANCWYKIVLPDQFPVQCDILSTGNGCKEPSWGWFDGDDAVQQFWVTWSIYNVNQWFTNLNSAITAAGSEVEGITGKVETSFNEPEVPSTPAWEYVLDGLVFATSLWAEGSEIEKALVRVIPQTFALTTKVYPQGEVEGVVEQWSDIEGAISEFIRSWADDVGNGIELVENDEPTFVSFAEAGSFTSGVRDLSGLTDSIYTVIGTELVSVTAATVGYIITRTAGQSIADVQATSDLQWDVDCGDGYDSIGICGPWYYDGTDTYSLTNQQKWQQDESDLMQLLFEGDSPLADANIFFTGSLKCSQTSGKNGGGAASLGDDYTTFNCLANNRVCTWAWEDSDLENSYFLPDCTDDDVPNVFDFKCCTGTYDNCGQCAPFAYFGPAIETDDDVKLCHTNCGGGEVE